MDLWIYGSDLNIWSNIGLVRPLVVEPHPFWHHPNGRTHLQIRNASSEPYDHVMHRASNVSRLSYAHTKEMPMYQSRSQSRLGAAGVLLHRRGGLGELLLIRGDQRQRAPPMLRNHALSLCADS